MSGVTAGPESTAERVALWRALHVGLDSPPVLDDEVGLHLVGPDASWRERGDMDPGFTRGIRAWIAARSRFVEDMVARRADEGVDQYVLLGAGVDTFVQRRADLADRLRVFEIDQPAPQAWKRARLAELGLGIPPGLRFVPVDFEAGAAWWEDLAATGFDPGRPAVVASLGVSVYLTDEANDETLRRVAAFASGTTLVMTFQPPLEYLDEGDRPLRQAAVDGAGRSGTPFISFYAPADVLAWARAAGFSQVEHVSGSQLGDRYFADRADGLRPATGEDLLVATV